MRLSTLPLLAALLSSTLADVQFTSPAAGASFPGGGSIPVTWKDSGDAPSISDLTTYQLFLCAGGNDEATIVQLAPITTQGAFANGNKAEGTVAEGLAGEQKNAYFLKMVSVASTGGTITNFSPRFTLTGMTGVFPAAAVQGLASISGTDGPARINALAGQVSSIAAGPVGAFAVPFWKQTGLTRYAAMQTYPGTKIATKKKTPLNPTSPYKIATTFLPAPTVQNTITQQITWSFSQAENTIAAATMPSDPMQKFLNRWKD